MKARSPGCAGVQRPQGLEVSEVAGRQGQHGEKVAGERAVPQDWEGPAA